MSHKIVVCGTGKVSRAATTSMIEDLHNSFNEDTEFFILLSDPQSDAAIYVGEWATDFELPLVAVSMLKRHDIRQGDIWQSTDEKYQISKASEICTLINDTDVVVVAYDKNDQVGLRVVSAALSRNIKTLDLTMGLAPVVVGDDDDDDIPEQTEVELVTDNNPMLEIRRALVALVETIDSYQEKSYSTRVLAD